MGVLLCHGFTGCPQSLRPWGEYLAEAGLTVSLPRLPGHGTSIAELARTRWEDWFATVERSLLELADECDHVFVAGLSMGGTLALRLAQTHSDLVRGLVLVNPSLYGDQFALKALPVLRFVLPTFPGPLSDIRKEGVAETGYPTMPLSALYSLTRLWLITQRDLPRLAAPILLYRSAVDHVVGPLSGRRLLADAPVLVSEEILTDSYHVATLDSDAPAIFAGSLDFFRDRLASFGPQAGLLLGSET